MATIPLSGTDITLLRDIPFQSDYKHTRWFDTRSQQRTYFNNKPVVHQMSQATFQRTTERSYVSVNLNKDQLWGANYMMFRNSDYNNKWFYAFIIELEYKNPSTTWVHFEIDVFQTWWFDVEFKPSYVVREHRPLWSNDGSPIVNTLDEGLDYGTDYDVVSTVQYQPLGGYKWMVIVAKEPLDGSEDTPRVIGTPQALHYYVVPYKDDNTVPNIYIEKLNQGVAIGSPADVLQVIYTAQTAVNNIVSIYVTDWTGVECSYNSDDDLITFPDNGNEIGVVAGIYNEPFAILEVQKVKKFKSLNSVIFNDVFSQFDHKGESKLLMSPYSIIQATDFKGNTIDYKPEYFRTKRLSLEFKGSLGVSNKTTANPVGYNRGTSGTLNERTSLEEALINNTPSDIPIKTDNLAAFLQGNRNSLETQKSSIVWNGQMNAVSGIAGVIGSASRGNVEGALGGAVNTIQGAGNSVLQLEALQSKQQDIANIPPQIAKMGSNTAYDYGHGYNGVFFMKKQIKPEYRERIANFFNMYGYKTLLTKIPNFHTRRYWNYVQTVSCVILGNLNNEDLNELKSIFDNGITLWHTDNVGDYSLNNEVI